MAGGVLREAYDRFYTTGPEWGENQLTNHGPMAAEVLVRRGHADMVDRWVDRYIHRLHDLPEQRDRITATNWADALGDERRVTDWGVFFEQQLGEKPWREVLSQWWERLLPGMAAGTTHGVIRVGHVARALMAGGDNPQTLNELAHALAFWAARMRYAPTAGEPAGGLDAEAAIDRLPRIGRQEGTVAMRFGQISDLATWSPAVAALREPATPEQAKDILTDLVTASTMRYLRVGQASPILLVHTATAPNAVLHALPALPQRLWAPSLSAVWTVTAAIFAAYAPAIGPDGPEVALAPTGSTAVDDVIDRAADHGDEHVIKFTDTAAEVFSRTGRPEALSAAVHISTLIDRP